MGVYTVTSTLENPKYLKDLHSLSFRTFIHGKEEQNINNINVQREAPSKDTDRIIFNSCTQQQQQNNVLVCQQM